MSVFAILADRTSASGHVLKTPALNCVFAITYLFTVSTIFGNKVNKHNTVRGETTIFSLGEAKNDN
jgi:hypothetical protein